MYSQRFFFSGPRRSLKVLEFGYFPRRAPIRHGGEGGGRPTAGEARVPQPRGAAAAAGQATGGARLRRGRWEPRPRLQARGRKPAGVARASGPGTTVSAQAAPASAVFFPAFIRQCKPSQARMEAWSARFAEFPSPRASGGASRLKGWALASAKSHTGLFGFNKLEAGAVATGLRARAQRCQPSRPRLGALAAPLVPVVSAQCCLGLFRSLRRERLTPTFSLNSSVLLN